VPPGDFDLDGKVTVADVSAMLTALSDLGKYDVDNGLSLDDLKFIGDLNADGQANNLDIQELINLLAKNAAGGNIANGTLTAVPEPASLKSARPSPAFAPRPRIGRPRSARPRTRFATIFCDRA
jgi:hypothetical protein